MKDKTSKPLSDDQSTIAVVDLPRIDAAAERLNSEAADVLEYQARIQTKDDTET